MNLKYYLQPLCILIFVSVLVLGGCTDLGNTESLDNNVSPELNTQVEDSQNQDFMNNYARLEGTAVVELVVNGSPITIELKGDEAPVTAGNFVDLIQKGVYDGLAFHRIVKEPQPFVVQGGDPQGKDPSYPVSRLGTGGYVDGAGQRRYIPLEIQVDGEDEPTYGAALGRSAGRSAGNVTLKHTRGAVAMARSQDPDSASAQFYFALADLAFLDGDYAVFGYVTAGMDVVDQIAQGDRIESARVVSGAENFKPAP